MGANVFAKVVGAHEPLQAGGALEALLPRVGAEVSLQLVGAREGLGAEKKLTLEGPLARVPAQVRLQVRGFCVHLGAARHVTEVQSLPARHRPVLRHLNAVRAAAAAGPPDVGGILCSE